MHATLHATSSRRHLVIGGLGLLWNLVGLAMFAMQVSMSAETLAALPDTQRAVYEATPMWINLVFGIAVASGVIGCLGILLRRQWAAPVLLVSLVSITVQMVGAYLVTPAWSASGATGLVLPVLLVVIAFVLWRFAAGRAVIG